ncbi:MAG: hypothetical protein ACRDL4_12195 [Thermoleophilaceae bacterium]
MAAPEVVDAYLASMPDLRARRRARPGLDERALDRLLGLVAEAAVTVRRRCAARDDLGASDGALARHRPGLGPHSDPWAGQLPEVAPTA